MSLSIIIPAYNEEKYIADTLKKLDGYETIVVCNGCTDRTKEEAEKHATKVIELKDKGVSAARNVGARAASFERLVFLDADMHVDNKVLGLISTSRFNIGTCKVKPNSKKVIDKVVMWGKSQVHRLGTCTGLIFCDENIFEKASGFEENLSIKEDGRFLRRAIKLGRFGIVNGYVYNNMRRFNEIGYLNIAWFWVKAYMKNEMKEYKAIR